jgi:hypothetical protein
MTIHLREGTQNGVHLVLSRYLPLLGKAQPKSKENLNMKLKLIKILSITSSILFVNAFASHESAPSTLPAGLKEFTGCWTEGVRKHLPRGDVMEETESTFRFTASANAFGFNGTTAVEGGRVSFDAVFTFREDGLMDFIYNQGGITIANLVGVRPLLNAKPNARGRMTLESLIQRLDLGEGMEYRTIDAEGRLTLFAVFHDADGKLTGTLEGTGQPISCDNVPPHPRLSNI